SGRFHRFRMPAGAATTMRAPRRMPRRTPQREEPKRVPRVTEKEPPLPCRRYTRARRPETSGDRVLVREHRRLAAWVSVAVLLAGFGAATLRSAAGQTA